MSRMHVAFYTCRPYICVCVCVHRGLNVDCVVILCVCLCVHVCLFLCVSVPEKADLWELCSTFTPLLIHPSLPLCLPGWTGWREGGQTDGSEWVQGRVQTDSKHSFSLLLLLWHSKNYSTLSRNLICTEHFGYFKKKPFSPLLESLRNCSYSSNRRHWLCFFSQIRTGWSGQQTVGGQGSQHSEYLERKRLCLCELFETQGRTMEQVPSVLLPIHPFVSRKIHCRDFCDTFRHDVLLCCIQALSKFIYLAHKGRYSNDYLLIVLGML